MFTKARRTASIIEWVVMSIIMLVLSLLVSEAMALSYTVTMRDGKVVEFQDMTSTARFVLQNEPKVSKIIEHHEVVLTEKLRFKKVSASSR